MACDVKELSLSLIELASLGMLVSRGIEKIQSQDSISRLEGLVIARGRSFLSGVARQIEEDAPKEFIERINSQTGSSILARAAERREKDKPRLRAV